MTPVQKLLSTTSIPAIAAPMFLISNPKMALACCEEGIVGSFPALNRRKSKGLEKWLGVMNAGIARLELKNPGKPIAPYAVNIMVRPDNERVLPDALLCGKYKVPVVITSFGVSKELIDGIHSYGGIVLHDVVNVRHAKSAARAGVDGLIAVCAGAGGHAGTESPVTLVNEIRSVFNGIVGVAGGLSTGRDIFAAQAMGADFAYMGTRFIATEESGAAPAYKRMIVDSTAADIIYTDAISGHPANFLRGSLLKMGFDEAALKKLGVGHGKLELGDEAKAWKTIWSAGHGVSMIHDIPTVAVLAERLRREYGAALARP